MKHRLLQARTEAIEAYRLASLAEEQADTRLVQTLLPFQRAFLDSIEAYVRDTGERVERGRIPDDVLISFREAVENCLPTQMETPEGFKLWSSEGPFDLFLRVED